MASSITAPTIAIAMMIAATPPITYCSIGGKATVAAFGDVVGAGGLAVKYVVAEVG